MKKAEIKKAQQRLERWQESHADIKSLRKAYQAKVLYWAVKSMEFEKEPVKTMARLQELLEKGEDSTRPLDSTRYFETAQGIKTYSEVSEILAVSVAKTLEVLIDKTPEEITITPEWICKLHGEIASSLFTDWAGRFRDVNVVVGMHTPPPYFEVPIHVRRYCDDLAARLSFAAQEQDIETFAETLAFVDWRFQWIHPFKDFNGRMGRILLAAVLFKLRLPAC